MSKKDYTYIISTNTSSQILFFSGVTKLTKGVSTPKDVTKPNATGQAMEAWSTLTKPTGDTVEGGLYSKSFQLITQSKAHRSTMSVEFSLTHLCVSQNARCRPVRTPWAAARQFIG
jgi:hypothetical protein